MGVRESLDQDEAQCTVHSGRYKGKHQFTQSHCTSHRCILPSTLRCDITFMFLMGRLHHRVDNDLPQRVTGQTQVHNDKSRTHSTRPGSLPTQRSAGIRNPRVSRQGLLGKVSLAEASIRAPLLSKLWRERQVTWALESVTARIKFRFGS